MTKIPDWRHISNGYAIPSQSYVDQPYIVKTDDGAWLCVLTTGVGVEGERGQHVVTLRSTDMGKSWREIADVEPADGPEASYAVLLKVRGGRVYCFYNHNTDHIRRVKSDVTDSTPDGFCLRVDSLGHFVFKYSDDHGKTWSEKRYDIPVREFEIDRRNADKGAIQYFWNVGKPFIHHNAVYVPLHKVGGFGYGFFTSSEGVLLKSANILSETDPDRITWETLPDGDVGLRSPQGGGPISEEQSCCALSDGSFYCVYRTIDGHPACAYSRDEGHTWEPSQYNRYADGRLMKHPRAANFVWKCSNGKYLYWFHNHGGKWYDDRNPVWICGGVEADGPNGKLINWSQPEILLYDDDPYIRMSYPDLIEDGGKFFITETQKSIARVHEIPVWFLEKLWGQLGGGKTKPPVPVLSADDSKGGFPETIVMPKLSDFLESDPDRADYGTKDLRNGFTIEMLVELTGVDEGSMIIDNRTHDGRGFCLKTIRNGSVEIVLNDGRTESSWRSEDGVLRAGTPHRLAVVVDGGPKIISFIVDGRFCDGSNQRQFGWGRFNPNLQSVNGSDKARICTSGKAHIRKLRIYDTALTNSELCNNSQLL